VVAVAQALLPLQEFMLKHLPAFSPALALIGATANMATAAVARAIPVVLLAVIIGKSSSIFSGLYGLFPLPELRGQDFPVSSPERPNI
jgi:hypothetical protein